MVKVAGDKKKSWIPKVPKKLIKKLAERIWPIVRFASGANGLFCSPQGLHYYIKAVDLFDFSYVWGPKPADKATNLKPLCDITTYHSFGYAGLFKPSVAEVLAQIPAEYLDEVVAFEIVEKPETAEDLNRNVGALNAGYHVAKTRLYAPA